MESENRQCQNCKKDFTIEPEDFNFYEKIKVSPPTFCPECRTVRRLCWRNEMTLFKRQCNAPKHNEMMISFYPLEEKLVVYDNKYWWGDDWDAAYYGCDYDFSKSFFQQWKELFQSCPMQALSNSNAVNSNYCHVALDSRNSYMSSGSWKIEQTFYSNRISEIKDSSDLYVVYKSELCYECIICSDCFHLLYSINCKNCVDSYLLYDCNGCINCFGCTNLRNKSYCVWNKQLSKKEYEEYFKKLDLKSYKTILELKEKFKKLYLNSLHRFAVQIKTINSTGDNLRGTKNCKICFDANGNVEDSKYSHWLAKDTKDAYDSGPGIALVELVYEIFDTGDGNFRNFFTSVVYSSNEIEYAFNCHGCSNLFGCIGVKNKKYCILNKQYTKDEYEQLIPKIKQHMMDMPYVDKKGRIYKYGEFFPVELSPFCYNETQAQDYFTLTKEKAIEMGYRWREEKSNEYEITMKAENLPDNFDDVQNSITKEVIGCLHKKECQDRCKGAYKITEEEFNLYKRLKIPLPRLCFSCRHDERLRKRNPMKLWHRKCMKEGCQNEFETSYAPDRPEIVYCEKCYQQEVY
ncbi:MAG: hypothetical protein WC822_03920 [Candidatus Paceibacterota bacterium]|jgi:hypothetical protein